MIEPEKLFSCKKLNSQIIIKEKHDQQKIISHGYKHSLSQVFF
jgi:hypothetical protein